MRRKKWSGILVLVGILLLIGVQGYAAEIDQIQQAIKAKQARWVAKENPISKLPPEVRKKMLGAPDQEIDTGAPLMEPYGGASGGSPLPTTYDWRNVGGKNFVTPVRDQKTCGSCWAFATTAALEAKSLITFNWPGRNLDLSEQIVLSCSGGGSCDGGYASLASEYLKNTGIALESCYPYTHTDEVCSNASAHWQSRAYKIASWQYVSNGGNASLATIKNAILSGGPVVAWFKVYGDFSSYWSGVYTHTWGTYTQGNNHYVLVTGWDDSNSALIVKNSWGTSWGALGGYFMIDYSELTGDTLFGYWTYGYGKAISPPNKGNPYLLLLLIG